MRRQVTHALARATSRKRALAAVVLTPWLALQGCAKSEEQPEKGSGTSSAGEVKGLIHAGTSAVAEVLRTEDGREYVAGQLLVRFKPGTSMALTSSTHGKLGTKVLHTFRTRPELQVVQVDPAAMDSALAAYRLDARVAYAEPNFVYRISTLPNDTRFGELWGMHNTGQSAGTPDVDINAPEAWDLLTGSETAGVVTVIDTGVDYTHPDLTANMWVNPGEIAGNKLDDDGNGYVDDVYGINAITGTGDPKDDNEHGTHVSGTIAGRGNNALGVAGVNWTAKVMGCKFLDAEGSGTSADAIKCLDYVHMMKTRATHPVNIIATSNSWGGGSYSQTMFDSIAQQRDDGTLFVAAAGNDALNNDTTTSISYPASYFLSNVISVASHDRTDKLSSFSTYGRRTVHVAAPGSSILSSVPGGTYDSFDGTSMATPHVSGLVALLKAQDPSRDWKQLKNLVLTGAVSSTGAVGKTLTGKRLRAADTGGKGSLTCANQVLNTRVRPIANTASITLQQQPLQLIAYNIKCDAPNGPPTITVTPGGGSVSLTDTGTNGDQTAGDGLYTGYFDPLAAGSYTLTFPDNETLTVNVTSGYVENPAPYAWRTITGTSLSLTDDSIASITSPFGIPFAGGTAVTSLSVGMNGGIRTGSGNAVTFTNSALPYTTYSSLLAPFWDDLFPGPTAADNVFWAVTGTTPNRELVVEWRNVHHRDTRTATPANTVNFQVVFFEGKSDILYNYKDVLVGSAALDKGANATVGVQVTSTNASLRSHNSATLENETSILWTIPAPATAPVLSEVTASPTTLVEGDTLELGGTFTDPDGDSDGPFRLEFDLNYNGSTFALGTYKTTSTQGTVATSATLRSSGTVTVAARAVDRRGSRSAVKTVASTLTVTDAAPVLAAITAPTTINEKQSVAFTTSFIDPGLDAPWRVQWDWDYDGSTFTADQTVSVTTAGPTSVSRTFAQDGTYTVAARITDKDGVMSNMQVLTVNVADLKPLVDPIISPASHLKESQTLEYSAKFTDPGDASKPWRVQWDYNYDGTTFDVDSDTSVTVDGLHRAKRSMTDSGSWTYAMRVVDADGSISDVRTLDVVVDEVSPVLADYTARPLSSFEGEPRTVSFSLKAASGAEAADMDPVRNYLWDFDGDGTFDYLSLTPEAIFTYRDNPAGGDTYAAIVRVEDEDTYTEQSVSVVVRNVAPTLTFVADQSISEGRMLMTRMQATDPGNDTVTYSLSGAPEGMSITTDGLLVWTLGAAQVETPYAVTVIATDDDGDSSSQVVTFTARNMAPTLAAIPGRSVNEGSLLSVRAQASDMGNGSLSFSLSGAPEGMSITTDGLILWTPGSAQAGASYPVTVTVTDTYGASASQSFTIEARNVAPTLAALKVPASINEGSSLSVRAQASDPGNGTLSFNLSGAPEGMAIGADGLILWTPASAQTGMPYAVTVTVTDEHGASASQSFTLEARNVVPTLAALKVPASINEGSLLSVRAQATDAGNGTLSYSLSGAPAGMSITADGFILWTPGAAQAGASYTVTVTVADEQGASASQSFTIEARNVAPTLAALKVPASINAGNLLSVRAQATDAGNGTLSYSLSGAPEGMSITADGLILWTPASAQAGASYTVTVTVADEHGASASQSFTIEVRNVAPTLAALNAPASINEGSLLSVHAQASSPSNSTLSYSLSGAPAGMSITANGLILWTPASAQTGMPYAVTVTVVDEHGASASQSFTIEARNVVPTLAALKVPASINAGNLLSARAQATDAGNGTLSYSLSGAPAGMSIGADGFILWTPASAQAGASYTVTVTVADEHGASASQSFTIEVRNVGPTLAALQAPASINEGSLLSVHAQASSPSNSTLSYSLSGAPAGMSITANGLILWTPASAQAGASYTVTVTVADEHGASASESFTLEARNVAPTLAALKAPASINEGSLLSVRAQATDAGNGTLSYSLSGAPEGMSITADGLVLWTPAFAQTSASGTPYTVTVTATDEHGASASQSFTLAARWMDTDGDGMPDSWERANGTDPMRDDASGDTDGDGVSNLDEFNSSNGGPVLPETAVAKSPLTGTQVDNATLVLSATHVKSVGSVATVRYQFQLFSDVALTAKVRDVTVDQEASGDSTSASLTDGTESTELVDLQDNHTYGWRVRVTDGTLSGPWSQVQRIRYNPLNDLPGAPRPVQPVAGSQVSTLSPVLVVDNVMDADDATVTYRFEVAEDAAFTLARQFSDVAAGERGSTSWTVAGSLKPFVTYYWRATAMDPHGGSTQGTVSSFSVFVGRPVNRAPGAPALVSPAQDVKVASATPALVVNAAVDSDGDALTYVFELDTSATFGGSARQLSSALTAVDGKVGWTPATLQENGRYFWRVRALDAVSTSDWAMGTFVVNARNDAPSAPVTLNPSEAVVATRKPTLTVQNAVDPEGDGVTYTFEVRKQDSSDVVASASNVAAGANGLTSVTLTTELDEGGEYVWVARATDAQGAASAVSAEASFLVFRRPGNDTKVPTSGGCNSGPGELGGLLPLMAMALGLLGRRRRR